MTPNLRLLSPLGQGGMGHVWIAEHLGLRSQVVVKFMAEHLTGDPLMVERFSREAAAASRVRSPHVVQMLDHGVASNGHLFIAMELLEGHDLGEVLAHRRRLAPERVLTIVQQTARALTKAHEAGIVHRDIKPENIFLLDAGGGELFVKVLDFGVAKSMASLPDRGTATGAMVGTPHYMSPEQVLGARAIDAGTDLWALGVVAFEALTGTLPFNGETLGGISVAICHEPLPSMCERNAELPASVDVWFARTCARDHEQRFRSAMELAEGLRMALSGSLALPAVQAPRSATAGVEAAAPSVRTRRLTTGGAVAATVTSAVGRPRWVVPAAVGGTLLLAGGLAVGLTLSWPVPTNEAPSRRKTPAASAEAATTTATSSVADEPTPTSPVLLQSAPAATTAASATAPTVMTATTPEKKPEPTSTANPKKKKRDVVIE